MNDRKTLPKTALPRIFFIDREIASGKYPNAPFLAKKYETSVPTINRDIALMRDQLNAPIEYDPLRRGFYYSKKTYRLPAGYASADDMLALGMVRNLLALYQGSPLYASVVNLLEGITAPLDSEGKAGWYENRVIVPPVACAPVNEDAWNTVITGLRGNKILCFEYKGVHDREFKARRVRPYQLLFDTSSWFLLGYSEERKDIRLFALPRMRNAELTGDTFTMPRNYDYRGLAGGSYFGLYVGHKTYKFSIAVSGEETQWIRERTWAADQRIKETEDGIIISFTSHQFDKVLQWVLSQGMYAKPLAPEALVSEWERHVGQMYKALREK
ncbi:MAG: WYL domain-containing protein [Spirochaetales bacterium]|jgi:predicted DNA-binding transcriptional regulator YafY|nr:WYL domain-containing protein [Spirochaetales bacterium]